MSSTPGPLNTFMADTVGVVWRATSSITGASAVDPWTQNEINSANASSVSSAAAAGGVPISYNDALAQSTADTSAIVAQAPSYSAAASTWASAAFNDDGTGCNILTNPAGCYPSWFPYALIGVGVLVVLYILGPYVGLIERE